MTKFITEESFWTLFPEAEIGVVVLKNVNNTDAVYTEHPELKEELQKANQKALQWLDTTPISQSKVIAVWREAFQKFKKKKGNRSSIEALLTRVHKGNEISCINPLVDIYNTASLTYALPVGGEDIDCFVGDLRLTVSENGGDAFLALGDEENNPTLPGELCYLDDAGAVCRCWNWRDGQRTMLTENTKKAFLIVESVDPTRHADLLAILDRLAEDGKRYLGAEVAVKTVLTAENREVEI